MWSRVGGDQIARLTSASLEAAGCCGICVKGCSPQNEGDPASPKEHQMDQSSHAQESTLLEEAVTVLFCLVDDVYQNINPNAQRYERLKKLSDSEVIALALFQQLRGNESQRSFLRDLSRFFSHLFPGVVDLAPSSLHRRIRKLRRFLEPLRRAVLRTSSARQKPCSSTRHFCRSCTLGSWGSRQVLRGRPG